MRLLIPVAGPVYLGRGALSSLLQLREENQSVNEAHLIKGNKGSGASFLPTVSGLQDSKRETSFVFNRIKMKSQCQKPNLARLSF